MACFGNVLRGDDGLGPAVAEALSREPLPPEVTVMDVGIGGIHLVQELLGGVDVLLVVDAVDLGRRAGTVVVQRPQVADLDRLTVEQRRDLFADMHYATPERALALAHGLGVLPPTTLVVGVQTTDTERVGLGLSAPTEAALASVLAELRRLVDLHSTPPA